MSLISTLWCFFFLLPVTSFVPCNPYSVRLSAVRRGWEVIRPTASPRGNMHGARAVELQVGLERVTFGLEHAAAPELRARAPGEASDQPRMQSIDHHRPRPGVGWRAAPANVAWELGWLRNECFCPPPSSSSSRSRNRELVESLCVVHAPRLLGICVCVPLPPSLPPSLPSAAWGRME